MQILRQGVIPELPLLFTCGYCSCEWYAARPEASYNSRLMLPSFFSMACPTCGYVGQAPVPETPQAPAPKSANGDSPIGEVD